jgi:hypothetical protein
LYAHINNKRKKKEISNVKMYRPSLRPLPKTLKSPEDRKLDRSDQQHLQSTFRLRQIKYLKDR